MKSILRIIKLPFKILGELIIKKGKEAEVFNNRELVKRYLLKGYDVYEIAEITPMTLSEVASHVRYWMGEIPHERQIR